MEVQYWLAELDQYGNPKLCDGAHQSRSGAEKAATIICRLGLARDRRFAVAEVHLSELTGEHDPVNEDAIRALTEVLRPAVFEETP
jgi:hypothetical protein